MEIKFSNAETLRIPTNVVGKFIEVELYYHKGGLNVFTYKQEARGYYVRVVPVEVKGNMVAFTAFSGTKVCILEVSRKSAKAEREAVSMVNGECQELLALLVKQIANKNNLEV